MRLLPPSLRSAVLTYLEMDTVLIYEGLQYSLYFCKDQHKNSLACCTSLMVWSVSLVRWHWCVTFPCQVCSSIQRSCQTYIRPVQNWNPKKYQHDEHPGIRNIHSGICSVPWLFKLAVFFQNFLSLIAISPLNRETCMQSAILFPNRLLPYNRFSLTRLSCHQGILCMM